MEKAALLFFACFFALIYGDKSVSNEGQCLWTPTSISASVGELITWNWTPGCGSHNVQETDSSYNKLAGGFDSGRG